MTRYTRHIFVCINERPTGHPRGSCGGDDVRLKLRDAIQLHGLAVTVRSNRAGCLDACEAGVSMVVYPEGVWYGRVTLDDVDEIVREHLIGGQPVERLRLADAFFCSDRTARRAYMQRFDARLAPSD